MNRGTAGRPRTASGDLPQVGYHGGIHLDIDTDDVDAEVARLGRLGAKQVAQVKTWG